MISDSAQIGHVILCQSLSQVPVLQLLDEDTHIPPEFLFVLQFLSRNVGLQFTLLYLTQNLTRQVNPGLPHGLRGVSLGYFVQAVLLESLLGDGVLVSLPQQEVQDLLVGNGGVFESFPHFEGYSSVFVEGFVLSGDIQGVFEANGQMLLEVMEGGGVEGDCL